MTVIEPSITLSPEVETMPETRFEIVPGDRASRKSCKVVHLSRWLDVSSPSVIDGSLTVNGQIVANGAMVFTNADVAVGRTLAVGGTLTTDGMAVSNGTCRILRVIAPRIHIDNGTGGTDYYGHSLTNITFGGTADAPDHNLREYIHNYVYQSILNDRSALENTIRAIVDEYIEDLENIPGVS